MYSDPLTYLNFFFIIFSLREIPNPGSKHWFNKCFFSSAFDKINLKRIIKLKELTNVGYSGHLQGIEDSVAAICLGAVFVEKHFTIDASLPGRDNKFAITPKQLNELSDFREKYIKMTIDHGLDLQDSERDTYDNYRGRWSKE